MLTVFLRHDESKTLSQINQQPKGNGWYRDFPPQGIEVVSWYVLMGIGQVVTLRFPAERLREINRLFERRRGERIELSSTLPMTTVRCTRRNARRI